MVNRMKKYLTIGIIKIERLERYVHVHSILKYIDATSRNNTLTPCMAIIDSLSLYASEILCDESWLPLV